MNGEALMPAGRRGDGATTVAPRNGVWIGLFQRAGIRNIAEHMPNGCCDIRERGQNADHDFRVRLGEQAQSETNPDPHGTPNENRKGLAASLGRFKRLAIARNVFHAIEFCWLTDGDGGFLIRATCHQRGYYCTFAQHLL